MNQIETELQQNEGQYKTLIEAETKLRQEYIDAAGTFLKGWFLEYGKNVATWEPEVTQKLSMEELKGLKAELKELAEKAPAIAAKHFADCSYWMRGGYQGNDNKDRNSCLRAAAVAVAPILSKRGYRIPVDNRNGVASMGGTLGEDGAMDEVRKRYDANLEKLKINRNQRQRLQEELNRSKAANRWDSA